MIIVEIFGWFGAFLILVAFWLNSTERINSQSLWYQNLNLLGAVALIVNAFYHQAWPLLALDVVWGIIACISIVKIFKK